ncbi:peptidase S8/S53 domain-containing protein [Hypoxylon fragiforme]|uniref:peptidase S8/S53 domain-containing protein n=1 Tax=Hypoxylon fragiforme TaxID=63214 RepID=UPI0020C6542F|nr:peptidase S8/S53 domain-containing protein [Hypoxylon fragiforme]KAI2603271.1 peptidase S8/S53 domain-containing protein [Hypoxylon fragiforme]
MRASLLLSSLYLAAGIQARAAPNRRRAEPAPVFRTQADTANLIDQKYIVKMKRGASVTAVDDALASINSRSQQTFNTSPAFQGFTAKLNDDELEALRDHPDVDFIEQDAEVHPLANFTTQADAKWALSRVSSRVVNTTDYTYDDSGGQGVCVWMFDTGIWVDHPDFEGRAVFGQDFSHDGGINNDLNGHGTWTAGLVGSKTYGVAKKASLIAVKVVDLGGRGNISDFVEGMEYVQGQIQWRQRDCPKGYVINISLAYPVSPIMDAAAAALVEGGVFLAVAAGNNGAVVNNSPGTVPTVCTVGSTNSEDVVSWFSNYGPLVDIFAPGENVLGPTIRKSSTWPDAPEEAGDGTSASAPLVAGLAAYLLSLEGKRDPAALCDRIKELGTKNILNKMPGNGTTNNVIFNGNPAAGGNSSFAFSAKAGHVRSF